MWFLNQIYLILINKFVYRKTVIGIIDNGIKEIFKNNFAAINHRISCHKQEVYNTKKKCVKFVGINKFSFFNKYGG